jgi:hypothetical protein
MHGRGERARPAKSHTCHSSASGHDWRAESVIGATTDLRNHEHELQRVTHRAVLQVLQAAGLKDSARVAVRSHEADPARLRDDLGRAKRMPTPTEEQSVIDLALNP